MTCKCGWELPDEIIQEAPSGFRLTKDEIDAIEVSVVCPKCGQTWTVPSGSGVEISIKRNLLPAHMRTASRREKHT